MNEQGQYDSTADTLRHAQRVAVLMGQPIGELLVRSMEHDHSKTEEPELSMFNEYTPKLKGSTYGSDEYKGYLASMGEALDHHYRSNRHHPEHFETGIDGMTLVDLLEMLADWRAATERHADGSMDRSLEIQAERFGISPQLLKILHNTASWFGWVERPGECGVRGKAPNGDTLACTQPAGHERSDRTPGGRVHSDGKRDGLWWRDGELGGFEGGEWRLVASFPAREQP